MNKIVKNLMIYMLIVLAVIVIIQFATPDQVNIKELKTSELIVEIKKGNVESIVFQVDGNTNFITGVLKPAEVKFIAKGPWPDEALLTVVRDQNIPMDQIPPERPAWWAAMLMSFLPILLLVFLFLFLMQQSQGGGGRVMQFGKSKAKLHTDKEIKVTFQDVAGAKEEKEELVEIVEFLKSPQKFNDIGAKIPKGVLLFGPPGTGKTLLARAIAGEAKVPFFSISGSDFVEMFVGVGASRVRDLFEQAKKNAPCIVFIDEIDAVGRQRGAGLGGGHDEREQTLNQLLVEMDGFSANESIIIIAATNRPDILDPALLRPGRFDRQIAVTAPDVTGRKEILQVHIKNKKMAADTDLDIIARRTPGFTGADLANLVNEAALLAARFDKKKVEQKQLEDSIERVIAGPEKKSKVISEKEKRLVSYHEAGHALVGYLLPETDPVHKVSIIPRGRAGGYTLLLPKEDRHYMTRSMLIDQIIMLLGGRVAEEVVLKEISTGAQNDLERVTEMARKMIMEYGMSERLGPLTLGQKQQAVFLGRDIARDRNYSEEIAYAIDQEVRKMVDDGYAVAKDLLTKNIKALHAIAEKLMDIETLTAKEFMDLMKEQGLGGVRETENDPGKPIVHIGKKAALLLGKKEPLIN
ncbi:ATP-dependent zinc metalloprotease FtsH [Peptococcaceae bacterium]|nr:ATP-dependent zinc metalloprotease FtsH [Peptococcaceae bacterium]